MSWLDVLRRKDKESTVEEMAAAHVDLEGLHEELNKEYRALYGRLIELQQNALGGGSDKEVKTARVELLDLEEKLEAAASGQRTLRGRMGEKLKSLIEEALSAVPAKLENLQVEDGKIRGELIEMAAKTAVGFERSVGCTAIISGFSPWKATLPSFEMHVGTSFFPLRIPESLSPEERASYAKWVEHYRSAFNLPCSPEGASIESRRSALNRSQQDLEKELAEFDPEKAVIPYLRAAGSRAFPDPEPVEMPPEPRKTTTAVYDEEKAAAAADSGPDPDHGLPRMVAGRRTTTVSHG